MQLVYIEWEDASAVDETQGWVDRATAAPAAVRVFRQAGFVVDCDLDAIVLTEAYDEHNMSPRTRVPLGMIRRWVDLDDAMSAQAQG